MMCGMTKSFHPKKQKQPPSAEILDIFYFIMCALKTINFLASRQKSVVELYNRHTTTMDLFSLIVSPPRTGKIMKHFENSDDIGNTTSSMLTKPLSKKQSCFLANPEIFEYLNKILRQDDENDATSVTHKFCASCFPAKGVTYATENRRTLNADCSFR